MTLTTEQRSEINRRNGQKSQGPKTDEGKAKSRQNATKHGLRAENFLAMAARRSQHHSRPRSIVE